MNHEHKPGEKPARWNPTKKDWSEIGFVLAVGAAGGVASWVYGLTFGDPVPGDWWAIPISILFGAFAAGIGVYVLTHTDTSAVARTLFFAALCGFVWKPVVDAGKAFVHQAIDAEAVDASERAVEVARTLAGTPPAQLPMKLEEMQNSAEIALEALPRVHSLKARRKIETQVNEALRITTQIAPQNPQVASTVIQSVGETAAKHQAAKVSNVAVVSLDKLAETNRAFVPAQVQLKTNIVKTVAGRYLPRPVVVTPQ